MDKYAAVIALDWADRKHDGCLVVSGSERRELFKITHKTEAIDMWIAAMGTNRSRFNSAEQLRCFSGLAPVIERSGNHTWIRWRYSCNKFLRQSFQEWAGVTIKHSLWARAYYAMQRLKGKSHPMAVRALASKWIRIVFRLWKEKKTYSEAKHLAQLQRSGSPIIKFLADNPDLEKLKISSI